MALLEAIGRVFVEALTMAVAAFIASEATKHLIFSDKETAINNYVDLAAVMSEHPDMGIFRRFGELNNMSLLYLQAEIGQLEEQYKLVRAADKVSPCHITRSCSSSMQVLAQSRGTGGTR